MSIQPTKFYAVDRIESGVAVMVDDELNELQVNVGQFRAPIKEGTVMKVPDSQNGPDWSGAIPDEKERERRLSAAQAKLRELQRKDPGGNLSL
jgi:hypothetical protein